MKTLCALTGIFALCICLNSCLQMPTKIYRKGENPPPVQNDSIPVKSTAVQ